MNTRATILAVVADHLKVRLSGHAVTICAAPDEEPNHVAIQHFRGSGDNLHVLSLMMTLDKIGRLRFGPLAVPIRDETSIHFLDLNDPDLMAKVELVVHDMLGIHDRPEQSVH